MTDELDTETEIDRSTDTETDIDVDALQAKLAAVREEVGKRLVGQRQVLDNLLVCVLCDGNALLESNPGLAKTLTVRTLANVADLSFSRIQNTPDLMPSDITGTEIIRESETGRDFVFEKGPIFANVVLADEINRATPKTQAALLEAMEEQQVTAAGDTYQLPEPFFVMATQNPIDQEGSLHPDESLYMNGQLWRAGDALDHAKRNGRLAHDGEQTRVYEIDATTQTLAPDGEFVEADCLVYETEYDGDLYTVETKTGRSIRVSGNHPFLVNRRGAIQWVQARHLDMDDHLVSPRRLEFPEREFASHEEGLDALAESGYTVVRRERVRRLVEKLERGVGLTAEEVDALRIAAELSKRELAAEVTASYDQVLGFLAGTENGIGGDLEAALRRRDIDVSDYVEDHTVHRIGDAFTDARAGFFIGFVLAEGTVTDRWIDITQKNLPAKFDRWVDLAEAVGLDVKIRDRPSGREARIHSKPFVEYLDERFHLTEPERLLSAPEPFRRSFLEVILLTESHYDAERRRVTFSQNDRTLTNLVAHLLLGVGIVPWLYERDRQYILKIQGEDIERYLESFEWRGETPEIKEFDSAHRTTPLDRERVARLVDLLGMEHDGSLSDREWYNSYRWLQTERDRMTTPYFEALLEDAERTLEDRHEVAITQAIERDIGDTAKRCGLSMTDIAEGTELSENQVWRADDSEWRPPEAVKYVAETFTERIAEAEALTTHLRELVDGDVFYDRITSIESEPHCGSVVGLSVPGTHNYLAGLGSCGVSHNTFPLPEAQTDRFLLKIIVDYPAMDEEVEIVDRYTSRVDEAIPVEQTFSRPEIRDAQALTRQVPIADDIRTRAVELVRATRDADQIEYGASPRASMALVVTAKARALIEGRAYVSESDVEAMAAPVLRHRIVVDFQAEREGTTPDDAVEDLL